MVHSRHTVLLLLGIATVPFTVSAQSATPPEHPPLTWDAALRPYDGPVEKGVDTDTLYGKIMCGYQGWFAMPTDGAERGTFHWGNVLSTPARTNVDLWPDVSELSAEEKFPTSFRHSDGSPGYVFSSAVKPTVLRHFKWMKDYGIDGAFIQRFTEQTGSEQPGRFTTNVLAHCREGANTYGRSFAVMYDTNFDRDAADKIKADWRQLVDQMHVLETPAYQRHRGAPVVALWGYGFEHRRFDRAAAEELLAFFKAPENGGCTILLGVPNDWREWGSNGEEQGRDKMALLEKYGDIVQPWNVGRYGSPEGAAAHFNKLFPGDIAWCKERDKDYYAVIFPGFSWANMHKGSAPLNQIPRLGGRFFWSQAELVKKHGMNMAYVAMFDEVDEGTAIFKCTNNPPGGRFVTYEGLPSDHYLKLASLAGRMLRGESVAFPEPEPDRLQLTYEPMSLRAFYAGELAFDAATEEKLRKLYAQLPVTIIGGERAGSTWTYAFTDQVFRIRDLSWKDALQRRELSPSEHPVLVFVGGGEDLGFEATVGEADAVAELLGNYVRQGGTLVLLSGGRFPLYYPTSGRTAKAIGLELAFLSDTDRYRIQFGDETGKVEDWSRRVDARVPARSLYPQGVKYASLAPVIAADGTSPGDAIAAIGPGGPLGKGRIVFVARDLADHSQKEALLAGVLEYIARTMPK